MNNNIEPWILRHSGSLTSGCFVLGGRENIGGYLCACVHVCVCMFTRTTGGGKTVAIDKARERSLCVFWVWTVFIDKGEQTAIKCIIKTASQLGPFLVFCWDSFVVSQSQNEERFWFNFELVILACLFFVCLCSSFQMESALKPRFCLIVFAFICSGESEIWPYLEHF